MKQEKTRTKRQSDRGELAREKLISVALDLFGRYGFEATTTRMLRDAAGINLQAIPYYFGGKEGLYMATATHIGARINSHISGLRDRVRSRLMELGAAGQPLTRDEARGFLTEILQTMAGIFVSKESEPWARFLIREQMEPTAAFHLLYGEVMKPMFEVVSRLVGALLNENPLSEHVRLRTISLLGSLLVFRMAHAAVKKQLDWDEIGTKQVDTLKNLAKELVGVIAAEGGSR